MSMRQSLPGLPGLPTQIGGHSLQLAPMRATDLEQVVQIETDVYPHPWSHGNFLDALASGYLTRVVSDPQQKLIGYFLLMMAVDEAHLLNISVRRDWQRHGIGRMLLDQVTALARASGMASILLEVRPSNQRAVEIYRRYGYVPIGLRKNYYPAADNQREDAIVMRFSL
jgi:ribosomal-protein-alanine N-acetyltransferase